MRFLRTCWELYWTETMLSSHTAKGQNYSETLQPCGSSSVTKQHDPLPDHLGKYTFSGTQRWACVCVFIQVAHTYVAGNQGMKNCSSISCGSNFMVLNNFIQVIEDTLNKMTCCILTAGVETAAVFGASMLATAFTLVTPPAHLSLRDGYERCFLS